jgi:AraC-like DNA-binding protein
MVFCLMEGPDKDSCAATHREANGIEACNLIEVDGGMYSAFMSFGQKLDQDLVINSGGDTDSGFRFILSLDIVTLTTLTDRIDFEQLKLPEKPRNLAGAIIRRYQGRELKQLQNDIMISVFQTPESAVQCAVAIRDEFRKKVNGGRADAGDPAAGALDPAWNIRFRMGISVGQPVTEHENRLFEKAINQSSRLCRIADDGEIMASVLLRGLSELAEREIENNALMVMGETEQEFLDRLFEIIEGNISDHEFSVDRLSREIGISRPHLYRKVHALTGLSPVGFIRDLKLSRALQLIKHRQGNISEIALEVGFNNPSYFAKCFQDKYGIMPSRITGS